jgi:hypothetical protein
MAVLRMRHATCFDPHADDPPIEAVVFAWGVNEDGQLGLERVQQPAPVGADNIVVAKVVEACLGQCAIAGGGTL